MSAQQPSEFPIPGNRIRLKTYVERFDSFLADPGLLGTITTVERNKQNEIESIAARMDEILPNCEYWKNQIIWNESHCYEVPWIDSATDEQGTRETTVLEVFLSEVEILLDQA